MYYIHNYTCTCTFIVHIVHIVVLLSSVLSLTLGVLIELKIINFAGCDVCLFFCLT